MIEYEDIRLKTQFGDVGVLSFKEKEFLRSLAKKVKEIANKPCQQEKILLWKKHNSLQKVRPMVLSFPEGAWQELIPYSSLQIEDPFWRSYEYYLKRLIYRGERIFDDNVVEAVIEVPLIYFNSGWGIESAKQTKTSERGAAVWEPVLKECNDIKKLKYPKIIVDYILTQRNIDAVSEVFGDILLVKVKRDINIDISLIGVLVRWRGIENLMIDMIDNPRWVHEIMELMQKGTIKLMDYIENNVEMDLNNGNDYVGSGGVGYSDELGTTSALKEKVGYKNLWGRAESQDYDIISPSMYDEFAVQYQIPLLERFGLNCYGCCESLDKKFDIVKRIPKLRRVSVSPWTNISIATEKLQDKYIFSWKPNPAQLVEGFDQPSLKKEITRTLDVTKGCIVEMILKDTHTVNNHPERIEMWVKLAKDAAMEGYK